MENNQKIHETRRIETNTHKRIDTNTITILKKDIDQN